MPGSDVWRINHANGDTVQVSSDTIKILSTAAQVSEASEGAFNITIGSLTDLWHFSDSTAGVPNEQALSEAITQVTNKNIIIDNNTVTIPPKVQIDLGGIAKGHIVDKIAEELRNQGVMSALLNFGGNIVTIGSKPDGSPWSIGLQTPGGERGQDFWAAVNSIDSTVVTSGAYERGFDLNNTRYHHILDPRTGWPVQNGILTVTVITKSSLLADALTTAMFVLGVKEGLELAHKYNVHAVFLSRDGLVNYTNGLDITFVR